MHKHSSFSNLLKEPLLHFLLLGAGLFLLYSQLNSNKEPNDQKNIVISKLRVESLTTAFFRERGRFPVEQEIRKIIENDIAQEVLYREALALKLDQDDVIIHRRLSQKMKYLFEDLAILDEPTNEELEAYVKEHPLKFTVPATLSFSQVYFKPKLHKHKVKEDLNVLRTSLKVKGQKDAFTLGDRSLFSYEYINRRETDVLNIFGEDFSKKIFDTKPDIWQGPFTSEYGLHFVYIYNKHEAKLAPLEQIKERVTLEYNREKQKEANEIFFKSLRDRYHVIVEYKVQNDSNVSTMK